MRLLKFLLIGLFIASVAACGGASAPTISTASFQVPSYMNGNNERYNEDGGIARPDNAIDVYIVYAPETQQYMPRLIQSFNQVSVSGKNPVTGAAYASGQRPIFIHGQQPTSGSSGSIAQGIVNAIIAPNNSNTYHPTIFQPSVSHWFGLVNLQSGKQIFDLTQVQPTALTPVIMATWESRYQAIVNTVGSTDIGWDDLLAVLNSPNGWQDYGIPNGRRAVFYGHTDPNISSTGLSTTIAEFYACARKSSFSDRRLTQAAVNSSDVQGCVRGIEQLVRHYSSRTEDFLEYISRGPDYLDFLALEETDLICLNRGAQQGSETCEKPQEKLIAIYPKEGTFWDEHPFATLNADWVTQEQKDAAQIFTQYVLLPDQQRIIMAEGYRPANPDVPVGFPIVAENGVDPDQPKTVLDVPAAETINAIQQSWSLVKKQADITLLIDVSGSMGDEGKLEQAKEAALAFLAQMQPTNRVGLTIFNDQVEVRVPIGNFEAVREQLTSHIKSLRASGGTELYAAIHDAVGALNQQDDSDRIRALVLLSDGADTGNNGVTLNDALTTIQASHDSVNPVIVVPVAYGSDADVNALNAMARASSTNVQSGDPNNISKVLQLISSYF